MITNEKRRVFMGRVFIGMAIVTAALIWFGIAINPFENDLHYLIPQGREILELGHCPEYSSWLYFDNFKVILQNWAYAVTLALAYDNLGNTGILLAGFVQAMLVLIFLAKLAGDGVRDKFWSWLVAMCSCIMLVSYWYSNRFENFSVVMLVWSILCIRKYQASKQPEWLYLRILFVLIQMQFQAGTWPLLFCIELAYIFPHVRIPGRWEGLQDDRLRLDKHVILSTVGMIGALFINPYGADSVLYIFKSMGALDAFRISEQQPVWYERGVCVYVVVLTGFLIYGVCKNKLRQSTGLIAAGLLFLGYMKIHAVMFCPVVAAVIGNDLILSVQNRFEKRMIDIVKPKAVTAWMLGILYLALIIITCKLPLVKTMHVRPGLDGIVDYIQEHEPGNIICSMNSGSYLEFRGLSGIFLDSRPELLSIKLNGSVDAIEDHKAFSDPWYDFSNQDRYGSLMEYLDLYDIRYVIDGNGFWIYSELVSCMGKSGQWEEIMRTESDTGPDSNGYILYARKA